MELGPNQTKWIEALESGNYEQGASFLRKEDRYCCLGVACDVIAVPQGWTWGEPEDRPGIFEIIDPEGEVSNSASLPDVVTEMLGLRSGFGDRETPEHMRIEEFPEYTTLTAMNDNPNEKFSFVRLAAILRSHPELYFEESK